MKYYPFTRYDVSILLWLKLSDKVKNLYPALEPYNKVGGGGVVGPDKIIFLLLEDSDILS